ncbi:MAG: glycoside hydrolase family 3 N-terminal domain-containing protein [Candidatus Gastranaerophilales bacterium]
MNLRKKLYQMFILGTSGGGCEEALSNNLGGVIFFSNDIQSTEQFRELILGYKKMAKITPFLSIDQEGGRVERSENIHNGKKYLSAKFAFQNGIEFLKKQTEAISKELVSFGINLNFAPCVDVNTNPKNPIIGERAFSSDVDEVLVGGEIVSSIYRKNGIIPCAKHFPGHGDASVDSHLALPKIDLSLDEMERFHIKPFEKLAETIEMIMVAHLHCTCFEAEKIPTSLSKNAIDYLRNKLKFEGVIVSDDMIMQGVKDFGDVEACEMAIRAGVNLFIYRNSSPETIDIIEQIYMKAVDDFDLRDCIDKSFEKIISLKNRIK